MLQANWWGPRLSGIGIVVRLSGVDLSGDVTHDGRGGMGQEGTLHRQGAADREAWHGHITVSNNNESGKEPNGCADVLTGVSLFIKSTPETRRKRVNAEPNSGSL